MKKILAGLLFLGVSSSYAYTTIDPNSIMFKCSGTVINAKFSEADIQSKCKNVSESITDDVKDGHNSTHVSGGGADQIQDDDESVTDNQFDTWYFTNDANKKMKCYFKNHKYVKCKVSQ
jgi:hypothetical protein